MGKKRREDEAKKKRIGCAMRKGTKEKDRKMGE